ncbi:L-proline glycine betaine binding ABC transporter protein ProX (TC 3.A.1.12.1) [[Actinomadura] parvosata subsp. kistnae]|uniref:Glycine/betaine ABC transporter substrate-binding protein n=2 Tax=Nonomuraea TaxID=83681 RepID=A0A1V0AFL8_9ACTN|nr:MULTISPECIES: ABC transporter substrate-binding protein [unclassified Nonomuraea]AQZ69031.1 glycine/betaine ABC transporter substrate-binding protein [Nonomuraea sp. ATCC 55076]NJP90277.1 ABC transporter substrate-binding protein [Nonomuraea sp. FMUSA5-5]SPL92399.1 L-proline glycine betaine binding ABC transporter protein ProX (TC 3.A.1.12.1) [Actinomadura parvosata subsp. kistnae]
MRRKYGVAGVFLTAMLALAACGGGGSTGGNPLDTTSAAPSGSASASGAGGKAVVGSFDFDESVLLASIYAQALEAKGVQVEEKPRIGSREVVYDQVKGGGLTIVPEYNGNLLAFIDPKATAATTDEVNAALKEKLPAELEVLDSSPAEDKDSLSISKDTQTKQSLNTIEDLAKVSKDMVVGGPPEFKKRWEARFKEVYGLEFKEWKPTGPTTSDAIKDGSIQVGNVFTTDPKMAANNLVALQDPKNIFPAQNVTPLLNKAAASDTIRTTLNGISAKLTTESLLKMMQQISVNKDEPATVAKEWLTTNGLG